MMSSIRHTVTLLSSGYAGSHNPGLELADTQDVVLFRPGQTIASAVYLSGMFTPPVLCSGLARCGRCRVRILDSAPGPLPADQAFFSLQELSLGWRLGCRHPACGGMRVELPADIVSFARAYGAQADLTQGDIDGPGSSPAGPALAALPDGAVQIASGGMGRLMLALDLGTTTMEWRLIEMSDEGISASEGVRLEGTESRDKDTAARTLLEGSAVNPQMGAGSDVIARLAAAADPEGAERMSALALGSLRSLLKGLRQAVSPTPDTPVEGICLAANPAMTCLALGIDARTLARAPYSLPFRGGCWKSLSGLPPVWVPPLLSPFAGGDISAGYAALAMDPAGPLPDYPFLLADMGTNGEFLLALAPDRALAASVALGPALEGAGLSHGSEAAPGVITSFTLSPKGLEAHTVQGAGDAGFRVGITGTGYISLVSLLLRAGVLDRDGLFRNPLRNGAQNAWKRVFTVSEGEDGMALELPQGMRLYARDVEELLKVKAAFSLGLQRLLAAAGVGSSDIARVYLAGALGRHVDKGGLEELGFLPQGMAARVEAVGNSSLAGAALLLRYPLIRDALTRWAETVGTVELAGDPAFMREFPGHMRFAWKARYPNI